MRSSKLLEKSNFTWAVVRGATGSPVRCGPTLAAPLQRGCTMMQVVREYPLQILKLNADKAFERTAASITLTAEGPFVEAEGYLATLGLLAMKVGDWLDENWTDRWLISTGIEMAYAKRQGVRFAVCPLGTTPEKLAEYLLLGVFEPMFREDQLLVTVVDLWVLGLQRVRSAIDAPLASAYEREQAFQDGDLRRDEPLRAQTAAISASADLPIQRSGMGFNRGKITARP